jgi:hypothetical protein
MSILLHLFHNDVILKTLASYLASWNTSKKLNQQGSTDMHSFCSLGESIRLDLNLLTGPLSVSDVNSTPKTKPWVVLFSVCHSYIQYQLHLKPKLDFTVLYNQNFQFCRQNFLWSPQPIKNIHKEVGRASVKTIATAKSKHHLSYQQSNFLQLRCRLVDYQYRGLFSLCLVSGVPTCGHAQSITFCHVFTI